MNTRYTTLAVAWAASLAITYSFAKLAEPAAPVAPATSSEKTESKPDITPSTGSGDATPEGAALRGLNRSNVNQTTRDQLTGGLPMSDWLKHLMSQDDQIIRMTGFLKLLDTLDNGADIKDALAVMKENGRGGFGRGWSGEYSMLLEKWTQLNPKEAAAYLKDSLSPREQMMAGRSVLGTWTRMNPDEALAWAQTNGAPAKPEDGNWAVAAVVTQMAQRNLNRALLLAQTQPTSRTQGWVVNSLVGQLVKEQGPESALTTVQKLEPGPFQDAMLKQYERNQNRGGGGGR